MEMLVVVAIVGVTSLTILTNYRRNERTSQNYNYAQDFAAVLRRAQAGALSGFKYNGADVAEYRVSLRGGVGQTYRACAVEPAEIGVTNCTNNKTIESGTFPADFNAKTITLVGPPSVITSAVDIIFRPPYGDTSFTGDSFTDAGGELQISFESGSGFFTVSINSTSGRININ